MDLCNRSWSCKDTSTKYIFYYSQICYHTPCYQLTGTSHDFSILDVPLLRHYLSDLRIASITTTFKTRISTSNTLQSSIHRISFVTILTFVTSKKGQVGLLYPDIMESGSRHSMPRHTTAVTQSFLQKYMNKEQILHISRRQPTDTLTQS